MIPRILDKKQDGLKVYSVAMQLSEFDYVLPQELIAQKPLEKRDASRLMLLHRKNHVLEDRFFHELPHLLQPDDVLVLNDSKVVPARILFDFHGRECEIFYLSEVSKKPLQWKVLVRPGRFFQEGNESSFGDFSFVVKSIEENGIRIIQFAKNPVTSEILEKSGMTPLPPYIHEMASLERYQTVYARNPGSTAAPTAGLHFTEELFAELNVKGIQCEYVTLHVGAGTFLPVQSENIGEHRMHEEWFSLSSDVCKRLNAAKKEGRRIIAVGTTACRVLESCTTSGVLKPKEGFTKLFITPGYEWRFVDGMITNFHLPKSTLLMLVSALAGRDFIFEAYKHATAEKYRFFSFGDAMLIL